MSKLQGIKVGDMLTVVGDRWGRRSDPIKIEQLPIIKIGRKYVTVVEYGTCEAQFSLERGFEHTRDGTGAGRSAYMSAAAYEAEQKLSATWELIRNRIHGWTSVPPFLTQGQADNLLRSLQNAIGKE